ncbi:two-component response regulator 24 [Lathyrus oleraceus]|uniref:Response regulatory domain-containing protein n=1 Tax=Pisum sativum TaxID=3888 RepID=A0A9D4VYK5_PEA|nr:two-component response regulator 24-like [Pisum sativum]KAI5391294.1 hypothetical protein KIW84_076221 [Pisum sativum]
MEDKVDNKCKAIVAPKDDNGHNQDLPAPSRKVKVLIVDNDPRTLRIHENLLKSLGVETRTVKDGREAINTTAWNDYSLPAYDLILIGRQLPLINGIEVTKRLRAIGYPSRIVGVTRSLTEAEREEFLSAGVDDIVDYEKPMSIETVKMLLAATPRPRVWREKVIYDDDVNGNSSGSTSGSRKVSRKE